MTDHASNEYDEAVYFPDFDPSAKTCRGVDFEIQIKPQRSPMGYIEPVVVTAQKKERSKECSDDEYHRRLLKDKLTMTQNNTDVNYTDSLIVFKNFAKCLSALSPHHLSKFPHTLKSVTSIPTKLKSVVTQN